MLDRLYPVDFHAFHSLTGGEADSLLGGERRKARTPERTCVNVYICAPVLRHDKAEAFLIVKEIHLAIDHGAGRPRIAVPMGGKAVSPLKAVTAAVAVAETIATKAVVPTE